MWNRTLKQIIPVAIKRFIHKILLSNEIDNGMFFKLNNLRKLGYNPTLIVDVGAYRGEFT